MPEESCVGVESSCISVGAVLAGVGQVETAVTMVLVPGGNVVAVARWKGDEGRGEHWDFCWTLPCLRPHRQLPCPRPGRDRRQTQATPSTCRSHSTSRANSSPS